MQKKILLIILLFVMSIGVCLLPKNKTESKMSLVNENMLSFTVDGTESKTMPTKGSGYIASKITCTNGSIIVFDNDNWTIEVEKLDSDDACTIDFAKEIGSNTVTVTISDTSKIDSTSKTTTEGGKTVFYLTEEPDSIMGDEYTLTDNKLMVSNVTRNVNLNITMTKTLYNQLLTDKTTRLTRTNFRSVLTTDNTKTLYISTENGTEVYYFAGNATDNWVKFGGFYWRIIRTNSDGGVRLLYHGTSTTATDAYIDISSFNSRYNDIAYVSYMYGSTGSISNARTNQTNNSTIKTAIDNWYASNMTSYTKYLSTTAVYCNDRNTLDNKYFEAYTRLNTNKIPTYDCTATEDKFTVSNVSGNGKLIYPIALMTADEVAFAGGLYRTNALIWCYYNSLKGSSTGSYMWWLLSPYSVTGGLAQVFGVYGSNFPGYLAADDSVLYANGVRPVISLNSNVKYLSGDGSPENPYEIETK